MINNSIEYYCGPFTKGVIQNIYAGNKNLYNPVFFYGDIQSTSTICKSIAEYYINSGRKVTWITADEYSKMLIDALMFRKLNDFRAMLFPCDILIVENVEALSGRISTQEEFYYLFDQVFESGSQIVLTSLVTPGLIYLLEDRVRTQLQAGICCHIDE